MVDSTFEGIDLVDRMNEISKRMRGRIDKTQIKRYGGRLGHRDSRIGEKSWRFRSSSDRGTVRGSDGRN